MHLMYIPHFMYIPHAVHFTCMGDCWGFISKVLSQQACNGHWQGHCESQRQGQGWPLKGGLLGVVV